MSEGTREGIGVLSNPWCKTGCSRQINRSHKKAVDWPRILVRDNTVGVCAASDPV